MYIYISKYISTTCSIFMILLIYVFLGLTISYCLTIMNLHGMFFPREDFPHFLHLEVFFFFISLYMGWSLLGFFSSMLRCLLSLFYSCLGSHVAETMGIASNVPRRHNLTNSLILWLLNFFCASYIMVPKPEVKDLNWRWITWDWAPWLYVFIGVAFWSHLCLLHREDSLMKDKALTYLYL